MKKRIIATIILLTITIFSKSENLQITDSIKLNTTRLYTTIGIGSLLYVSELSYLSHYWYKDQKREPFHWYNDNKGYLQLDKCGHTMGAYIASYFGYRQLRQSGVSKTKSLIYGGFLGLFLQTPIEFFDAFYEGYGFSAGDMAANTLGSLMVVGQEYYFDEQIIKYKFSYRRSQYAEQAPDLLGDSYLESLPYDYNSHTYWLSMNLNKIIQIEEIPSWVNVAIGYSANGMFGEFKNYRYYKGDIIPETERYRQFLLSLDIDCSKIKTNNKVLKGIFEVFRFIKIPFPTLEYRSNGEFKGHLLYY